MIVCICMDVSDKEIKQALELGACSFADLQRDLGVATRCGQCRYFVKEQLNEVYDRKVVEDLKRSSVE